MAVRSSREEWKIFGNVFDKFTNELIFKLASQGIFDELKTAIALGKEANIFTATPGRKSESDTEVIVKIYRLENCNFRKMLEYLRYDPRFMHTKPSKRETVFTWCQREYRNLMLAREAINVPKPIAFKKNILVMSLVGENGEPARQLKDTAPQHPQAFAKLVLDDVRALWKIGLVHGDLSAFNILNHDEQPVLIDFSHGTPTSAPNAQELLRRDVKNVAIHFKKIGVDIDEEGFVKELVGKK